MFHSLPLAGDECCTQRRIQTSFRPCFMVSGYNCLKRQQWALTRVILIQQVAKYILSWICHCTHTDWIAIGFSFTGSNCNYMLFKKMSLSFLPCRASSVFEISFPLYHLTKKRKQLYEIKSSSKFQRLCVLFVCFLFLMLFWFQTSKTF